MKADYKVRDDEKHLFHVRFIKIVKEGKRTRDTFMVQKFHPKEWIAMTKGVGKKQATFDLGLAGVTQFDEIDEVLHDPTKVPIEEPAEKQPVQRRTTKKV